MIKDRFHKKPTRSTSIFHHDNKENWNPVTESFSNTQQTKTGLKFRAPLTDITNKVYCFQNQKSTFDKGFSYQEYAYEARDNKRTRIDKVTSGSKETEYLEFARPMHPNSSLVNNNPNKEKARLPSSESYLKTNKISTAVSRQKGIR
jgi:hypothetical protein